MISDVRRTGSSLVSVLRRETVFWAYGDPIQHITTYIPRTAAKGDPISAGGGIFTSLAFTDYRGQGVHDDPPARRKQRPYDSPPRGLCVPLDVLVIGTFRTTLTANGRTYGVSRFVLRTDLSLPQHEGRAE